MNKSQCSVHRRNIFSKTDEAAEDYLELNQDEAEAEANLRDEVAEKELTLMEEVLLLALRNDRGYTSFFNFSISAGLRGCILIELCFRGRVELDRAGMLRKGLLRRTLLVTNERPVGDILLDTTLKHIRALTPPDTVQNWIDYLTGETWTLSKFPYQLTNVRERLAKNLVEKGVLALGKKDFVLFDMDIHPIANHEIKSRLVKKIQDALLSKWVNDPHRMDKRLLSLIIMAYASDVLDNALSSLEDSHFEVAMERAKELSRLNFEAENRKTRSHELMWAVFAAFRE